MSMFRLLPAMLFINCQAGRLPSVRLLRQTLTASRNIVFKKSLFCTLVLGTFFMHALHARDILVEGKAAYFHPTDHKFQKIYSDTGIYGAEITFQTCRNYYGWVSADYLTKNGHSIGMRDSTRATLVPIGAGLKYLYPISCGNLYLGAGILGTYARFKDDSPYVFRHVSQWGVGGIFKAGGIINLKGSYFIDLFTNYSYMKMDFHKSDHGRIIRHDAHLGGWSFGAGLGCRFGC